MASCFATKQKRHIHRIQKSNLRVHAKCFILNILHLHRRWLVLQTKQIWCTFIYLYTCFCSCDVGRRKALTDKQIRPGVDAPSLHWCCPYKKQKQCTLNVQFNRILRRSLGYSVQSNLLPMATSFKVMWSDSRSLQLWLQALWLLKASPTLQESSCSSVSIHQCMLGFKMDEDMSNELVITRSQSW